MYQDYGRSKDEMTSAEQSGNTRLRKGVSPAPPGEVDTLVENAVRTMIAIEQTKGKRLTFREPMGEARLN